MKKVTPNQLEKKLCLAFENNRNVIVEGKHGVGKTSIIHKVIKRYGLHYGKDVICFSAATMDPWIDFLGVPKLVENQHGEPTVKLVKPEYINPSTLEVLFFDEFNRSPKRVRNAVMELIQFKSVNGVRFPKLKCVWAAINPEDEQNTYDIERTDPAQFDRFHLHLCLEDTINTEYFNEKFGEEKTIYIQEWYDGLEPAQKSKISPRRVEYAMEEIHIGGDPEDILPSCINSKDFVDSINARNFKSIVIKAANEKGVDGVKAIVNDFDSVNEIINKTENEKVLQACIEVINQEQLSACLAQSANIRNWCQKQMPPKGKRNDYVILNENQKKIISCMIDISSSKNNKSLSNWADAMLSMSIPGYKFVLNKNMTPSEFGYQAADRFDIIKRNELEEFHPEISDIKNWMDIRNITFTKCNKDKDFSFIVKVLDMFEEAIKSKKCRMTITHDIEYENIDKIITQLIHYFIFDRFTNRKNNFSPDDIDASYYFSKFYNTYKYLLLTQKSLDKEYSGYKITNQAKSFEKLI